MLYILLLIVVGLVLFSVLNKTVETFGRGGGGGRGRSGMRGGGWGMHGGGMHRGGGWGGMRHGGGYNRGIHRGIHRGYHRGGSYYGGYGYGSGGGYGYGYERPWYYPSFLFGGYCKPGCGYLGNGEVGCINPGAGCIFASDCTGC